MTSFNIVSALDIDPKVYAQEALIVDVTEEIWRVMNEGAFIKLDLARGLGCSKAHVTQLLNGSRNLTLRTLADIAHQLGCTVKVRLEKQQ